MLLRCKHFPRNLGFRHSQFKRCIFKRLQIARSAVFWVVTQQAEPLSLPLAWLTLRHGGDVPPKCLACSELHGVTTQRDVFFITTTVRTANPTFLINFFYIKTEVKLLHAEQEQWAKLFSRLRFFCRFRPTLFMNATLMEKIMEPG
jgi:hypothetical protein